MLICIVIIETKNQVKKQTQSAENLLNVHFIESWHFTFNGLKSFDIPSPVFCVWCSTQRFDLYGL